MTPDFHALGLSAPLAQGATAAGFGTPTPVQAAAIPAVLRGADLLASAQTGSGKTAAFALPLLQRLIDDPSQRQSNHARALVLVPTRELAVQVGGVVREVARHLTPRLRVVEAYGGVSINPQMQALRGGTDVLVATPGRLLDLADHNAVKLDAVQTLVLDEADRLLDLGFADELARVLALLPARRQNLFFSATFPPAVEALAASLLHDPVRVSVAESPIHTPDIAQRAIAVDTARRTELLRHLFADQGWTQALVFVATQHAAEHVAAKLRQRGLYATSFHGGLSQGARQQTLAEFKNGQWDMLITTDLAARGIDIAELPVVVNYDLPRSPVDYVHRIGRTGRAGQSGEAISLVTPNNAAHWRLIAQRQGLNLPLERVAGFEPTGVEVATAPARTEAQGNGGIKGKRPSKKDKLRAAAAQASKPGGSSA
ncbi:DEAD/DEAH box helicase [Ottowia sp. GY511]|uniref:DEAD/DEAH box helicase n=1 Tax=Ottowia flava TaxID=2675430 RepID=A0ABW4KNM9_9BURK|nr:DEAD/DEAH box helicase [Ottowia sp. GY511]TXK29727.1 DEAD/DEAH box helicase [Ottowia sp. GY511]